MACPPDGRRRDALELDRGDFAAGFLERLLAAAADVLGLKGYSLGEGVSPAEAHRMGCLYYGFLLAEDGARPPLLDILKDRELADELMLRHYEWALENGSAAAFL